MKIIYNRLKENLNYLENNKIIFVGIIMFSLFIYFRFIRERLPKDLPFNLTVLGFFILVEICFIYGFIVWQHLHKKSKPNEVITIIIMFFFKPLDQFDTFIKQLPMIQTYYLKISIWLAYRLEHLFTSTLFEILMFTIPRVILIFTFILDIFYFSKLEYIYYVLLLGVLLFLRRYILYSIKKLKTSILDGLKLDIESITTTYVFGVHPNEWPENIDPDDDDPDNDDVPPTMYLPLEIFINFYTQQRIFNNIEHFYWVSVTTEFYKKHNNNATWDGITLTINTNKEYDKKEKELETIFKDLLQLYFIQESYENIILKNTWLNVIKILIYMLYFLCWLYILILSLHSLNMADLNYALHMTWSKVVNPFTDLHIYNGLVLTKTLILTGIYYFYKLNLIKLLSIGLLGLYINYKIKR